MGYHRAGFDVFGVDIKPQPHYPFEMVQEDARDALEWLDWLAPDDFDAIHASPPCQRWSHAGLFANRRGNHENLIPVTRDLIQATGLPYVIENVEDARGELRDPVKLCGSSLGIEDVERHRYFETSFPVLVPPCQHGLRGAARFPGTPRSDGSRPDSTIVNQMASGVTHSMLAEAMGIDWMPSRGKRPTSELCQAIPPAYTALIGAQLLEHLNRKVDA